MVIAAVGMIWGLAKQRTGMLWGKQVATGCALVALACALVQIFSGAGAHHGPGPRVYDAYTRLSGVKLGRYLAEKYPGAKAVVVVNPAIPGMPKPSTSLLDGLREGLGNAVTIVREVSPEIPKSQLPPGLPEAPAGGNGVAPLSPPPMMMAPMDTWLTPEVFDRMLAPCVGTCDMVITTVGLPFQAGQLKLWSLKPAPKVVIAAGMIQELKSAISKKAIVAALTYNPNAVPITRKPSGNLEVDFGKHYLLVTPETVDQLAKDHPALFMDAGTPVK